MDTIFAIMTEEKGNQKETLKINTSRLKKYFPLVHHLQNRRYQFRQADKTLHGHPAHAEADVYKRQHKRQGVGYAVY